MDLKELPGPPSRWPLGHLPQLAPPATRFQTIQGWRARYGDVFKVMMGTKPMVFVADPAAVRHVLLDNARNYPKSDQYDKLKPLLGEGLLTSGGDFWLRQRRMMQPYFHQKYIAGLLPPMIDCLDAMLARWEGHAAAGTRVDVAAEMMALTLRIVGKTLLGTDVEGESASVGEALAVALEAANESFFSPVDLPPWWPSRRQRAFRRARAELDRVVLDVIRAKRAAGPKVPGEGTDMLDMLLAATDEETGTGMTDRQLRDEVMTIFLAGHETTAVALTWCLYLLSCQPEAARRVHAEAVAAFGDGEPTLEAVGRLAYTGQVIDEAMRLYPPIYVIQRQAREADVLAGFRVPAGTLVTISIFALHHNPRHWENPEGFDPGRPQPAEKFAYLPFAGGPRVCIGNNFALMEARLALAMMMRAFRADLVPGHPVAATPMVTLRAKHGLPMTLHRRI